MPQQPTQSQRSIAISTPLGKDVLLLRSFTFAEHLGRLFQIDANLYSTERSISFDQILGKSVTIRLDRPNDSPRHFNGIVSRFAQVDEFGLFCGYKMTIVPWLWCLTRASDCRVFQNQTVPEIIKQVFRDHGLTDFKESLSGSYSKWDYCVQYRETDFNFVSRLMEHEGIYYFFEHTDSTHRLVLADSPTAHKDADGNAQVPYDRNEDGNRTDEVISEFAYENEVQSGVFSMTDYNFEKPRTSLAGRTEIARQHDLAKFEMFDYPGEYDEPGDASQYSAIRIEEQQAKHSVVRGFGNVRGLGAGKKFTLQDYPRKDRNVCYLVTGVTMRVSADNYRDSDDQEETFVCNFEAIPATARFRAERVTPKPSIGGPQTAVVTGPAGEEIYTDKYGRVKVQFHWDRNASGNESSSCWLRVSQPAWAGKSWGSMYIPRIGQEVVVSFLDGDPDCPIVTGRVYNSDNMPPYTLPDEKTKTTLKSNSSTGGGGANEIRFEDKKGSEQIFIHAEKQRDMHVKQDNLEGIGGNEHLVVQESRFVAIHGDQHLKVNGELNEEVGESRSLKLGQNLQVKAGMNQAFEAGMEVHIKGGMNVVVEAGMSLTLKAAGAFVQIGPAGVAISGPMVMINSGGAAGSGSGCSPTPPTAPKEAEKATYGSVETAPEARQHKVKPVTISPMAAALKDAAESGAPFCEICGN